MTQSENIKEYCRRLNLSYIHLKLNNIIIKAQEEQPTYIDFLADALKLEADMRGERQAFHTVFMYVDGGLSTGLDAGLSFSITFSRHVV